jgi:hypothetical protein
MSWRLRARTDANHARSGARWWMGATIVAAGALMGAYLLDPEHGHARRMRVVERTGRLVGRTRMRISHAMPFAGRSDAATGPAAWPDEAPPDVDSES